MRSVPSDCPPSSDGGPIQSLHAEILRFVRLLKASTNSTAVADQSSLLLLWPLLHEGPMRLRELAESKGVDASTASRQAAQLVKAGLIRRDPDPEDGRAALLGITDGGREFCRRLMQARLQAIEAALAEWTPDRVATFADMLRDFNAAIEIHQRLEPPQPTEASAPAQPIEAPGGALTQEH